MDLILMLRLVEKVVVHGGDFCQILPMIPYGSREDIVHACINSSYLWHSCHVLQLTKNMRLCGGPPNLCNLELQKFANWLLQLGDGLLGDIIDGESVVRIPDNLLLVNESPALQDLVLFVYPDILLNISNVDYFKDKSILAPTLDVVTDVNNHVMLLLPGNEKVYLSSDSILNEDGHLESELYTMSRETLNALNCSGQTLSTVGVYLPRPVFTHGQLYVALSRVNNASGLKVLIVDTNGRVSNHTVNVVYREVFVNLLSAISSY
ncbi:uncharacterized protein LOC107632974 [Arachis ipaensis]|uniref:uncharacterized protein LOC107632974 n=1 Tax=Arachis ipaensis TaxID=130454 RepID=UPI0007AF7363|nr:uncharacterized protein LOC107632974 [Arachis ipaensis]